MGRYNPQSPKQAYTISRNSADKRAVDFEMTFDEWWDVWQQSGKFDQRGKGHGKYVMARINNKEGYKVGNVKIVQTMRKSKSCL